MKKIIFTISISILSLLALAVDSPYTRRIRPFAAVPASCSENEIGYSMTLNKLYICTNTGYKELILAGSTSFAPTNVTYITQTANTTLTNEQALGLLATGILKNTTTTGVLSIATEADYLPSQTGNNGKYLTTNGTITSWGTVSAGGITCAGCTNNILIKFNGTNGSNSSITDDGTTVSVVGSKLKIGSILLKDDGTILAIRNAGDTDYLYGDAKVWYLDGGVNGNLGATGLKQISSAIIKWVNSANANSGTVDLGLERVSDGVLGVDSGSAGTFRDLKLRNLIGSNNAAIYSDGTPSIAGNGTLNTGSKDSAGKITSTGTGASTVVLTFANTFTRAPSCFVTNETTANLVRPVSTTTTLTLNATVVTNDVLSYQCLGY